MRAFHAVAGADRSLCRVQVDQVFGDEALLFCGELIQGLSSRLSGSVPRLTVVLDIHDGLALAGLLLCEGDC